MVWLLLIIYALSVMGCYMFTRVAHSKGGRWHGLNTGFGDLIIMIFPVVNTALGIHWLLGGAKMDTHTINKFFGVKK